MLDDLFTFPVDFISNKLRAEMLSENGFADKLRKVIRSGLFGDRLEVFENSFFLQVDPETRIGRWVLGDLDHLKFGVNELKAMNEDKFNLEEILGSAENLFRKGNFPRAEAAYKKAFK